MYAYEIWLNGKKVSESGYEYDSAWEAYNEGGFEVNSLADSMDVHWSEFELVVVD